LPTILDNMIADGEIVPVIAVMIDAAEDRSAWYYFNPDYVAYLERVVKYVDGRWSTRPEPSARVHAGTSAGARASLQAGLERPDLFGNVALLSPSIAAPPHRYAAYFRDDRPTPPVRSFVSAGAHEGAICEDARLLGLWLHATPVYTHEGHSFGTWRGVIPSMLRHFFAPEG
jgi:enterochelin esterase-like enzyme